MGFFGAMFNEFLRDPFFNTSSNSSNPFSTFFDSDPFFSPRRTSSLAGNESPGRGFAPRRPGLVTMGGSDRSLVPPNRVLKRFNGRPPFEGRVERSPFPSPETVYGAAGGDSRACRSRAPPSSTGNPRAKQRHPELHPAVPPRDIPRTKPKKSAMKLVAQKPVSACTMGTGLSGPIAIALSYKALENDGPPQDVPPPTPRPGWEPALVRLIKSEILMESPNVPWDSIAGNADAKLILQEATILPTVLPEFFQGLRRPWRGILMFGPPGTGKTMLAKACATECGSTFFNVSPAVLTSKFRGDSEKIARILFEMAAEMSPSIIFIDEVDALCSRRGGRDEHEASRRFKSELLMLMDGLNNHENPKQLTNVILLGATNFPWLIDEAFRRRFEKRIYVPLPDEETRGDLLKMYLQKLTVKKGIDFDDLADKLDGYSCADIANVCRNAAMMPVRKRMKGLSTKDLRKMKKEDVDLPITADDITEALRRCKPSVSPKDILKYEKWMEEFESC